MIGLDRSDILMIGLCTALIGALSLGVSASDYRATQRLWESRLSAEVRYRAWTLESSLQQSQDDSRVLADFAPTQQLLALFMDKGTGPLPGSLAYKQVLGLFENYRKVYEYNSIYLLDNQGQVIVAAGGLSWRAVILSPQVLSTFRAAGQSGQYRETLVSVSGQEQTLIFLMPVLSRSRSEKQVKIPRGMVVIVSIFSREILPLLQARTVPTRTGETLLLQLQGNVRRYLSGRRFPSPSAKCRPSQPDTLLRVPSLPLPNQVYFGRFTDYREADVIAASKKIARLNGLLVCKMDYREAFSDFHRTRTVETTAAGAGVLAMIGMVLLRRRNITAREISMKADSLWADNEKLEIKVSERTTQLAELNEELQVKLVQADRADEEVRRLNAELEWRVYDRTAQLEIVNKELEAFAYSVSHDLRAPLRVIDGLSQIVFRDYSICLPEQAQHFLRLLSQNSLEMRGLIDGLLEFSRLSRQPLNKATVEVATIARGSWQDLGMEFAERKVEIIFGDLPDCEADLFLLKQVYTNLLSNALKYSRTREIARIEVGSTSNGAYYIRDNGVGFDMVHREKLFGVFQRLHLPKDYEGTGVGLAIVKRIVQRHGGRVWADAKVDQGAIFYFTLGSVGAEIAN